MEVVVAGQRGRERVDARQATGDVSGLRDRHGAVELDDRVGRERGQVAVAGGDALPAGVGGRGRAQVLDRDRGLQDVAPGWAESQGSRRHARGLGDRPLVPARAVLVVEQHHRPAGVDPGLVSRVMGKQERVQAERLGLVGHQLRDRGRQSDGLGAQGAANVRIAGARRVALVEHQVDHVERGGQALGQRLVGRHPERDPRGPDLRLGAYQALRHGRLRDEEGVGDLGRRQAAHHPQRQRHLHVGRERRMTAREDEPQPLVGHARGHGLLAVGLVILGEAQRRQRRELRLVVAARALVAEPIDGPVARHRDDPCQRVARDARVRPALQRRGERVLHGLFGEVPVADGADQRRDRPPKMFAEQAVDGARCRLLVQDAAPSSEAPARCA
jgi:hypothetical protein